MKNFFSLILILFLFNGCVPLIVGGAGVVTGFAISNDSARGNVKCEYRQLWDICTEKMESMDAETLLINPSKGMIKCRVSDYSVTIRIDTLTANTQKLKISARKTLMPKPQFAQKIFLEITDEIK